MGEVSLGSSRQDWGQPGHSRFWTITWARLSAAVQNADDRWQVIRELSIFTGTPSNVPTAVCTHSNFITDTYFGVKIQTLERVWCLPFFWYSVQLDCCENLRGSNRVAQKLRQSVNVWNFSEKTHPVLRLKFAGSVFGAVDEMRFRFSANMKLGRAATILLSPSFLPVSP